MDITAKHEDLIYPQRMFLRELEEIQEERFNKLLEEIYPEYQESIDKDLFTSFLNDYIFNYDEDLSFEEFLELFGY